MPTYDLATLEERVWALLDLNTGEFPETNLRLAINQGLYYLNLVTGWNQATVGVPTNTVAGLLQYATPAAILIPSVVSYEGEALERYSLERLARRFPGGWCTDQSSVYGPPARWASLGTRIFFIHPIDSFGGSLLEVTGIAKVTPLTDPTQVVNLEDTLAEILIQYAKIRVMLKETGKAFADAAAQWPILRKKIMSMSMWQDEQWTDQWIDRQVNMGSGRWPR